MGSRKDLVFIIGPGGVGKSTVGRILARKLGYDYLDLDEAFIHENGDVGAFIQDHSYDEYHAANSALFHATIVQVENPTVFVLSSGFLIHNEAQHANALSHGISILLLPSRSMEEGADIVVRRQMQRGLGLNEQRERQKFIDRFETYNQYGDIKVYSSDPPESIAEEMLLRLKTFQEA